MSTTVATTNHQIRLAQRPVGLLVLNAGVTPKNPCSSPLQTVTYWSKL
jgi:hypothetical protein